MLLMMVAKMVNMPSQMFSALAQAFLLRLCNDSDHIVTYDEEYHETDYSAVPDLFCCLQHRVFAQKIGDRAQD